MITMTCTACGANTTGNVAEVLAWDTNHSKECNA